MLTYEKILKIINFELARNFTHHRLLFYTLLVIYFKSQTDNIAKHDVIRDVEEEIQSRSSFGFNFDH